MDEKQLTRLLESGTIRKTVPLEPGQLKRALTALSAAYLAPQEAEAGGVVKSSSQEPMKAALQSELSHPLSQVRIPFSTCACTCMHA
jgi:hypothetical protein